MFVSTRTPSVFWGVEKIVLVFEIICLYFDFQFTVFSMVK